MPIILILIGFLLIIYNYKKINNAESFDLLKRQEQNFNEVLDNSKNDLDDYKLELGILRKNIGESLTEIQYEILEIKSKLNMVKDSDELYENINKKSNIIDSLNKNNQKVKQDNDVISEINFLRENSDSLKTAQIKELLEQGYTDNEISTKLSVSKGEILLVKGLFKN